MRYILLLLAFLLASPVLAQDGTISVGSGPTDADVAERLNAVLDTLPDLAGVDAAVTNSVVILSGEVANELDAERAVEIAERVEGVIAVRDDITRTLDVSDNISPVLADMLGWGTDLIRALPLIGLALLALIGITLLGRIIARRGTLIKRFAKNPFLVELAATAVRIVFFLIGLVVALNILGATALIGTVLGGAGIIGIALGFGIRDTVENYVASLLLSIRQPFRAQDHVVIDGQEGIVVRLNTRATILMTLDGNHLRIPNAKVFKADILNYTTNPQRRFGFSVGVDSADDPVDAIQTGVAAIAAHDFILSDPPPVGRIVDIGDSSIEIRYHGWIDQRETGFNAARSQCIRDVQDALEGGGFSLPEPIYRVKMDTTVTNASKPASKASAAPATPKPAPTAALHAALNTDAEFTIVERVGEEREQAGHTDLLDAGAPPE